MSEKPNYVPVHKQPAWLSSEDVFAAIRELADTGSDKAVCWDMQQAVYRLVELAHERAALSQETDMREVG